MHVSFWALNPDGSYNCALPDVVTWELSPVAGSPGAVTLDYPADGAHFDVLRASVTQDRDLQIAVWTDGQDTGSLRALLMNADGDDVEEGAIWRFSGHFFEIRMDEDVVQPRTTVTTPPSGPFPTDDLAAFRVYNATAGKIMATLMQESAADNVLSDITYDFTDLVDSNGVAWSTQITLTIAPGTTFTKVLEALVDARMCEWDMLGKELRLFEIDTAGVDRTLSNPPLILRSGRSITDSPRKHTVRDSGTTLLVAGDNALYTEVEDASAVSRRGRRIRRYASQGSITTTGGLTAYGLAKLPIITAGQMEVAHGLSMEPGDPWPLRDFTVHDWVFSDTGNGLERLRVAQATVKGDQHGITSAGVSLNDLIATELEKQAARLAGIEGGTTVTGTSNPAVDPSGGESMAPATPVGLTYTSAAYPVPGDVGFLSAVFLQWQAVNTNQDGTATSDVAGYRVNYRYVNAPYAQGWQDAGIRYSNTCDLDGLVPGQQMQFRVSCFDARDNDSGFSTPLTVVTAADATAPPVPAAPTVTEFNGVLIVAASGLGSAGETMPSDTSHFNVHRSTTTNFTPDASTKFDEIRGRPGTTVFEAGVYGTTYYFKLTSQDYTGNISAASAQASGVPLQLVGADLADGLINAAKLAPSAVTLAALATGSVDATKLIDGAVTGPKLVDNAVTGPKIAPLAVSGGNIAADTITAGNIAANAVTASELAANSVVAGKVAADTITAVEIAANAVTASELAANSVVAGKVAANTIGTNELIANSITAGKVAAGAISTTHLSVAAFGDNEAVNGGFEDVDLADPTKPAKWAIQADNGALASNVTLDTTAANVYSGTTAAQVALSAGAVRHIELRSAWIPTRPGELWYLEVAAKASRAFTCLTVTIDYNSGPDPTVGTPVNNVKVLDAALATSYVVSTYNDTAPSVVNSAATRWVRFKVECRNNDAAALTVWFDEVRASKVIGTAEIANAAIGTAQIANLAVQDGNVANLNVGKLVSGTGTFTMLMATGNIRSGDTGQRWIMDPAGLRFFNPAGTMTVDINNQGGPNLLTGTVRTGLPGTRRIEVSGSDNEIRYYASNDNTRAARIFSYIPGNFPNDVALEARSITSASSVDIARLYLLPDTFGLIAVPTVNEGGVMAGVTGSRSGLTLEANGAQGAAQTIIPGTRLLLTQGGGSDTRVLNSNGTIATRGLIAQTGHQLTVEDGTGARDGGFLWMFRGSASSYVGHHVASGAESFIRFDSDSTMALRGGIDFFDNGGGTGTFFVGNATKTANTVGVIFNYGVTMTKARSVFGDVLGTSSGATFVAASSLTGFQINVTTSGPAATLFAMSVAISQ